MENKEKYKDMNWKDIWNMFNEIEKPNEKLSIVKDVIQQKGLYLNLIPLTQIEFEVSLLEHTEYDPKDLSLRLTKIFQNIFEESTKREAERKMHQDKHKQLMKILEQEVKENMTEENKESEVFKSKPTKAGRSLILKTLFVIGMIIFECHSLYQHFLHTSELYEWIIFISLIIIYMTLTKFIITFILDDYCFNRALTKEREERL